ncbi:hypothetical protein OOU_Y34scaffold00697g55 [Pyricularia oryzae Y34]|uniref:Uncharacterized protein n=3 Tax=Pyricularia oryzae TaxID=318829 RepID=A0A4P7NJ06_PYROR|nr:hypothetical protein OOU_Y34scaffold00697g55 [Pyricularia oryzae Y34]QBZ62027.1 hypothetical protein PoMZ_10901 [Pyricularia oryzae]
MRNRSWLTWTWLLDIHAYVACNDDNRGDGGLMVTGQVDDRAEGK